MNCWMCGDFANSAEHRIKKSDLVRAFGRGPYVHDKQLVLLRDGKKIPVLGPKASVVKYPPSLCRQCNTTTSQPFDRAYDQFIDWMLSNERSVLKRRYIDFEEIFDSDWQSKQLNLYKYFAKGFGCRLIAAGYMPPDDVVELMSLDRFDTGLRVSFSVLEGLLMLEKCDQKAFVGNRDLLAIPSKENSKEYCQFVCGENVSWLTTWCSYNMEMDGPYGSPWIADKRYVYLGTEFLLDDVNEEEPLAPQ